MSNRFFMSTLPTAYKNDFAVDLDGISKHINWGDIANFDYNEPFTLSARIKTTGSSNHTMMARQTGTTSRGWLFFLQSGIIKFAHRNTTTTNEIRVDSVSTYNDGNYKIVTVTYDGSGNASGVNLYVDGSPISQSTTTDNLTATTVNTADCKVGLRDANLPFVDVIDEPVIFNYELTPAMVLGAFGGGVVRSLSYLQPYAWLRFIQVDKDNFPTMLDHSQNGRDGTAINMVAGDIVNA